MRVPTGAVSGGALRAGSRFAMALLGALPVLPATARDCPGAPPPPPGAGVCAVTAGGANLVLRGNVIAGDELLVNGQLVIGGDGRVSCAACDCSGDPGFATATRVDCPQGLISPGLIDGTQLLTFSQNVPAPDTGERYEHRHDWRRGQNGHTTISSGGNASLNQRQYAELRALLAGTTSINGSGGGSAGGLVRNLDQFSDAATLGELQVDGTRFPLGDILGFRLGSGCGYANLPAINPAVTDYFTIAEGIEATARNEWTCQAGLQAGGVDVIGARPVEGLLALGAADIALLRMRAATIGWAPRYNTRLYGHPGPLGSAARLGVPLMLGTLWTVTGSINLQRELACADDLNQQYYASVLDDGALWAMVTRNPARAFGADDSIGVLAPGRFGDVVVFDARTRGGLRAAIDAEPRDVVLVLRAGLPMHGDAAVLEALGSGAGQCDPIDVCGGAKRVCVTRETGQTLASLQAAVGAGAYPLFSCAGPPPDEPSCVPARAASVAGSTVYTGARTAADLDGDGVANAGDNCPTTFNPVRPVDAGAQTDADADGFGDDCDACPIEAGNLPCTFAVFANGFENS